jgi:two-component system nitrate/nitrite response regulator NarL
MKKRQSQIRILIADDHPVVREGLRRLLDAEADFNVVGQAADGVEALELVRELRPDVLMLDLMMPRSSGMEVLRELSKTATNCRVILLAAALERAQIVEALQLGGRGVVLKEAATDLMFKSIRTVMAGQYWIGRESISDLIGYLRERQPAEAPPSKPNFGLTRRELQIVAVIVAGYTNKDIAERFKLSEDTVKHHLSNTFDKLGVSNRLELALFAINHKLVEEDHPAL